MTDTEQQQPSSAPDALEKQGLGARALVAASFAFIGAKIGNIGLVMDFNHLFKDAEMSLGKKMHAVFSREFLQKIWREADKIARTENKSMGYAFLKLGKFTVLTTGIGVAVGAILGWTRGGRIEHSHDLLTKPIESFQIIAGFKEQHSSTAKNDEKQEATSEKPAESPASNHWQEHVASTRSSKPNLDQQASHVEALAQEVPSGQGVAI